MKAKKCPETISWQDLGKKQGLTLVKVKTWVSSAVFPGSRNHSGIKWALMLGMEMIPMKVSPFVTNKMNREDCS